MYGTVTTDFDRLFRELRCPVPQKISSFIRQAESLGLSFKFEVTARPDEFAGPVFDTQLTNHLDGKRFVFSRPHGAPSTTTTMMFPYTWSFLMTGKSQRSALGAKLSSSRKSTEEVTHKDLAANAEKLPVPSPHHGHRIVFVGKLLCFLSNSLIIDVVYSSFGVYCYWPSRWTWVTPMSCTSALEQALSSGDT